MQGNLTRDQQIAWAAGLFEGEGTMNAYARGKRGSGAQVRLGSTDRDVVERFMAVVGCGAIYLRPPGTGGHKPLHEWAAYEAAKVAAVIEMLSPWFGERRAARAAEVLAIARDIDVHKGLRTHCPEGHAYEGENLRIEAVARNGRVYQTRRCVTCRRSQERDRARKKKGITPDRYRV